MTRFFEVANVSATHIYHSALELSPPSSIVRRLYHHQRITSSPGLAIGIQDSWSQSVSIPNKDSPYRSCTWSPCGRFIAIQTHEVVEVRDALTSEQFSSLQSAEHTSQLMGPLAYSPDGRSLCCTSNTGIIIWDIQTGGIIREVGYDLTRCSSSSLVWSLDGSTIGTVLGVDRTWTVVTYGVTLGRILSRDTLPSQDEPYLWAQDKSFRVMIKSLDSEPRTCIIGIFEIGHTQTRVGSFPISNLLEYWWGFSIKSFSPVSHHVSISVIAAGGVQLLVLDAYNPARHLLNEKGNFDFHCFSPDGKLFVASTLDDGFYVWKYAHDHNPSYAPWRRFPYQGSTSNNIRPQFSPTSSSILGCLGGILHVWHLDDHSSPRGTNSEPYILIHPHATYTITARPSKSTITITDYISQTPLQVINACTAVLGFALTGNVLLVAGLDTVMAWRITERGVVDGVVDDRMANPHDSIWVVSSSVFGSHLLTLPKDIPRVSSITFDGLRIYIYRSRTGEGVDYHSESLDDWYNLWVTSGGRYYLRCHELSQFDYNPSEDDRPIPRTAFREGWVKDPDGKHRLWLPVEWRMAEGYAKLFHYLATLQFELPGDLKAAMF